RVVDEGAEQMLERDVLVPALVRALEGATQGFLALACDLRLGHQVSSSPVGSIERLSGYSCSFASCSTAASLGSATSRVYTPATPTPVWCTCSMMRTASDSSRWKTVASTHTTNSRVV